MGESETERPPSSENLQEELLKVFSSRTNRAILSLVAVEATYPRKIGNLLAISEGEAARRLKHMETLGVVSSAWSYIGKNIKLYRLAVDRIVLRFRSEGLQLELGQDAAATGHTFTLLPFRMHVPVTDAFLGRTPELDKLDGPERVVIVEGMPGVGKTALVAHYVQTRRGGRALFWHTFRGLESLSWLANRFAVFFAQSGDRQLLHALEQQTEAASAREMLLRGLDDPRFLIVFDDVNRIEDPKLRDFLSDVINQTQKAKVLLTGRESPRFDPSLPGRAVLRLGGFRDDEVREFFAQKGVAIDSKLLPSVRDEVGGHPLALNLLLEASVELNVPVAKLLDRIPERNIEDYLLQEVFTGLSDEERQILSHASVFRHRFNVDDLANLSRRPNEHLLLKMRRRHLVMSDGTDYSLHEVIRNFFYKLLKDRESFHLKAAQRYLERQTIEGRLEAMHHLLQAGKKDKVLHLLEENLDLKDFDFIDAGYQNLYYSVLEQFRKSEVTDAERWALILDEKGDIRLHQGDPKAALEFYDEATKIFEKHKRPERSSDLAWKRGLSLEKLGKHAEARSLAESALKMAPPGAGRERLSELVARLSPAKKSKVAAR